MLGHPSVMSGYLNGLQYKVLDAYSHAFYVHYYAHVLNLVLSICLDSTKEYSILNGIATFTMHSTKRIYDLTEYLKRKIPSLAATRWSFNTHLFKVIEEHNFDSGVCWTQ
jgi:hypothetical protein